MNKPLKKLWAPALVMAVAGSLVLATATGKLDLPITLKATAKDEASAPVAVDTKPLRREGNFPASFSQIVKKVGPSVVNIFTERTVKNPESLPYFNDPFFRRFFGEQFDEGNGRGGTRRQPRSRTERSLGSGVIITRDGYILTNNHVVEEADTVKVALPNSNREYTAKVIGKDARTDIAVLKIDATDLSYVTMADSSNLEVGDVVLAIGNPFGLGQSVTMGIVSAVGRAGLNLENYEDFIQTDAAINMGNSGGALVDAEGRLVGINTAILSRTGGNQGIGFAIPVNMARYVMDSIRNEGRVIRGYMGLRPQDLSPDLAKQFNVAETQEGALVSRVEEDSPASKAGFEEGDIITEFNDQPVHDARKLRLMAAQTAPGTKVPVKVLREGKERKLTVTLKEYPDEKLAMGSRKESQAPGEESDALNGVEVGDITPAVRTELNLPRDVKGAVITDIDPDSASYEAGLRRGDVIQQVDRKPVTTADEAVEASNNVKGDTTLVRVYNKGYIVVNEGKKK